MSRSLTRSVVASYDGSIIFVGSSTGGTEAIKTLLMGLPADSPPVLVVQHMPEMFTAAFAKRLDGLCALHVVEAQDGDPVCAGVVFIAPGHSHMRIRRAGSSFVVDLSQSPPVNRHRPAVDVLFNSAAELIGKRAIGVILTGMGKDGANGLKLMHDAGAYTMAQDKDSCVVFGMPRAAIEVGAVDEVVSLSALAERLIFRFRGG